MTDVSNTARLAVDIGGTFTDVALEAPGLRVTTKVLTTVAAPEEGVLAGIARVIAQAGIAPQDVALIIHGTTLATNAVIERKGAKTALITTEGFRDSVEMAYENRFEQYDINVDRPEPLVPRYLRWPVRERVGAYGQVLTPLDEASVAALIPLIDEHQIESVAVGLIHAYANPAHERRVAEIIGAAKPDLPISLSSEVCPEIREYERQSTTCANAYVQTLMARYLTRLEQALREMGFVCPFLLITSGGALTSFELAVKFPIRLVESGPAGGAILASRIAAESELGQVLSFDMGGTTAKICLIDDAKPQTTRTFEVARVYRFLKGSGLPVRIPAIEMVEIGAGGGSIAQVDAMDRVVVGPESAGAKPGPACYGGGGTAATVTDADMVMGRIDAQAFAGGTVALQPEAARRAIRDALCSRLNLTPDLAAFAIGEMVDENMANAARVHAIEWGKTLAGRTLIAFGGAAPLHAARLADKLGLDRVIVPADAGVGSAIGFLRAPIAYEVVRSRYLRLSSFDPDLVNDVFEEMRAEADAVVAPAAPDAALTETRTAYMRYLGQGHEIPVPVPARRLAPADLGALQDAFDAAYVRLYGRTIPDLDIEILSWTLELSTPAPTPATPPRAAAAPTTAMAARQSLFDPAVTDRSDAAVVPREDLTADTPVPGPALIVEAQTTTVVPAAFDAAVDDFGNIVLTRRSAP